MGFRVITTEEKAEAIRLVVEMNYSVPKTCKQTGVGPTTLRTWVSRWHKEHVGASQTTRPQDQDLIDSLQARLALLEADNDVLK